MTPRPELESLPGCAVLTLRGELDAYDAPALRESFETTIQSSPGLVLVLDLTAVTFLDSTVLGSIVGALRRLREAGGDLRLVLPDGPARRIFELTALDRVLDVRPSRAAAIFG